MDQRRLAPTVGMAGCLALLGTLAVPYFLDTAASGVGSYYASAGINPLAAGLFGLVTFIVFAAGREGRSDPGLAAGVSLAFGVFILAITVTWALGARIDAVQLTSSHRWVVVGAAALVPLSAGWYTRALGLV